MVFDFFSLLFYIFSPSIGSKCYRKNPAHFKEFSHSDPTPASSTTTTTPQVTTTGLSKSKFFLVKHRLFDLDSNKTLPVCPFGATCYRKNLLHFAEYSHPFNLLNPDTDSSDEEDNKKPNDKKKTSDEKKRKVESEEEDDGDKTEEYDSDDVCR